MSGTCEIFVDLEKMWHHSGGRPDLHGRGPMKRARGAAEQRMNFVIIFWTEERVATRVMAGRTTRYSRRPSFCPFGGFSPRQDQGGQTPFPPGWLAVRIAGEKSSVLDRHLFRSGWLLGCFGRVASCWRSGGKGVNPLEWCCGLAAAQLPVRFDYAGYGVTRLMTSAQSAD